MKIGLLIFMLFFEIISIYSQWLQDIRLTNDTNASAVSLNNARAVTVQSNYVHVVWYDLRDGNYEIFYKHSTDSGITWSSDFRLTNNQAMSLSPTIISNNFGVHVFWHDNRDSNFEIYYKRSTDQGLIWGPDTRLTNDSPDSQYPVIDVTGQYLYLAWQTNRSPFGGDIYYMYSSNSGMNWSNAERITFSSGTSVYPAISVYNQYVHVVWGDNRDNNTEIYYKRSTNHGLSWSNDLRLTNNPDISWNPTITTTGNFINVAWLDYRNGINNSEIYYKKSTDLGINWSSDIRLTNDSGLSWYPSIVSNNNIIHAVWEDNRDGNFEIYYKSSTDFGLNWETDQRLTDNPFDSRSATINVSGNSLYVIWQDKRDGNSEIYFKQNPTGNIIGFNSIPSNIPVSYLLSQNYPNPFNPETRIRFQLKSAGYTEVRVFNVLGNEVSSLINQHLKAGTYEVSFNAVNLPSGIYFYTLNVFDFTETKRMVLIK